MSQTVIDFSDDPSGTQLLDAKLTPFKENILSNNSGTSRPSYATAHTSWTDTTTTPWIIKYFDGTDDIVIGYVNPTTNLFIPSGLITGNLTATTNPTINDDSGDGYSVSSIWVNLTTDVSYICVDSTAGAAVWKAIPKAGVNDDITSLSALTSINGGSIGGYRNLVINGTCRVAQRPAATLSSTPQYGRVDRFLVENNGTGISGTLDQAFDAGMQGKFSLGVTNANWTTGKLSISTRLEAKHVRHLNGKQVTIGARIYHDIGSAVNFFMQGVKANASDDFSAITSISTGANVSCASGAWTDITHTFTMGSTDCSNGIGIYITQTTANTVVNKNINIGDIFLVVGTGNGGLEIPPYAVDLELCKRYLPAFTLGGGTDYPTTYMGQCISTTQALVIVPFGIEPRVPPTGITVSGVGHFALTNSTGSRTNTTNLTFNSGLISGAVLAATVGSAVLAAGNSSQLWTSNASAQIFFTGCEL